jgi:hypothetical protein
LRRSLNPALDIGQIEGGFVQGAGWLTMEELVWDDRGALRTHAPSTYKIPACSDRPRVFNVALWDGANREDTIYRSKAVGEPPLMLGISVHSALAQACAACRAELSGPAGARDARGDPRGGDAGPGMKADRVSVVSTRGSAPREAGAAMLVTADGIAGTIGGGALEWQAMAEARAMLKAGAGPVERTVSLGPGLGQCCGGAVTLRFEMAEGLERPEGAALWIWGAGHVGRALVRTLSPLPEVAITWIDTGPDRFPADIPETVTRLSLPTRRA